MRDMSIYEERDGLLLEVERLFKVAADALDRENKAKATIDGMHAAIERLNGHLVQLQEMAQHTNNAVEDAFGVKPSNEPDENHLALIEAAGYRLMRSEAAIERVKVRCTQMRHWGHGGRHAADTIENAIEATS